MTEELSVIYSRREAGNVAGMVLEHILQLNSTYLSLNRFRVLTSDQEARLREAMRRLMEGEPVQYVLGEADFCGWKFKVNPHVLIPRPETEELVYWIAEDIHEAERKNGADLRILDIGTGSGCIAISLAKKFPYTTVEACDVSLGALQVAEQNSQLLEAGVKFFKKDILREDLDGEWYDIMVSNPPYITPAEKTQMNAQVLDFEPAGALFVPEEEALIFYRKIGEQALRMLMPGGRLYFEVNEFRAQEVVVLLQQLGFRQVELRKDLSGKERMVGARR